MLEHITDNVGKVFLSNKLLLITQLYDTIRNTTYLFGSKFKAQFLEVLQDIGLA